MDGGKLIRIVVLAVAVYALVVLWKEHQAEKRAQDPSLPPPVRPGDVFEHLTGHSSQTVPDVAGDVSNNETDYFQENLSDHAEGDSPGRMDKLFRQLWLPASKVPVSALGKEDFVMAMKFLANTLRVGACPLGEGEQRLQEMLDEQRNFRVAWPIVNNVVTIILSIVAPVAGAIYGAVTNLAWVGADAGFKAVDARLVEKAQKGLIALQDFATKLAAGDLEAFARYLAPADVTTFVFDPTEKGSPSAQYGTFKPFQSLGTVDLGSQSLFRGQNGERTNTPVVTFWPRQRLLGSGIKRFYLPWVSEELGCTMTLRERVNKRARLYRTLDAMGCLMFPAELHEFDPSTGEPRNVAAPHLYSYLAGGAVPLVGSIFPPNAEHGDTRFPGHESAGFPAVEKPQAFVESTANVIPAVENPEVFIASLLPAPEPESESAPAPAVAFVVTAEPAPPPPPTVFRRGLF